MFVVYKCSSRQAQTHSQSAISVPLSGHIPYYKYLGVVKISHLKMATTGK